MISRPEACFCSNSFRCHYVKYPKRASLWLFFQSQITLRHGGAIGISLNLESHWIWRVTRKPVQTLGKPEIIIISPLFRSSERIKQRTRRYLELIPEATSGHSEGTSGPPDATTLKHSWAARILHFALCRSNNCNEFVFCNFWCRRTYLGVSFAWRLWTLVTDIGRWHPTERKILALLVPEFYPVSGDMKSAPLACEILS